MARLGWADKINQSVGDLVDQLVFGGGVAAGVALWAFGLPIWLSVLVGAVISCGGPVFMHIRFPGLYMTSGEKDDEFERTRRFGRKRDD